MNKINKSLLVLIGLLIFRAGLALMIPLSSDEAYYWLWSQHPALSYVDHPGMVAWINALFVTLFREPRVAVRLASLFTLGVTLRFLFMSTLELAHDLQRAYSVMILYLLIPCTFIIGITMQVEQPLLMFASIQIYLFLRLLITKQPRFLLYLGLTSGLGLLSKYTFILLPASMILWLVIDKERRRFMRHPYFTVGLGLCLITLSPLLIWNYQHEWISFLFQFNRIGDTALFAHTLEFILEQLIYISPVIAYYLFKSFSTSSKSKTSTFLLMSAGTIFIFFLLLSIKTKVFAHWTSMMYLPVVLYLAVSLPDKKWEKALRATALFTGLLVVILLFTGPRVALRQHQFTRNYHLSSQLGGYISSVKYVISTNHGAASQLSYYLKQPVLFPQDTFSSDESWGTVQFGLWEQPDIQQHDNILFFTRVTPQLLADLQHQFTNVKVLDQPRLTIMEDYLNRYQFIYCHSAVQDILF